MKQCRDCLQIKTAQEFYKNVNGSQGLHAYCKPCFLFRTNHSPTSKKNKTKYRENNRELCRKSNAKNKQKNPALVNFHTMKRLAAKLNRTPSWLTESDWIEIKPAYKVARYMTKETGIKHAVDHIIPLQGKEISGFHCPQNLQIIPAHLNESKGNKFQPGIIPRQ